ncbi:MAG: biotin--[acetyl-CoA-carboxylase] ligase [Nitrospinota bacterium]|nr:biotin--[acetyl-CoA-carboxylase] ligase [Nitrospinota bacterium]
MSEPSMLDAAMLQSNLDSILIGEKLLVFQETASTNDLAKTYFQEGAVQGLILIADRQTDGKGRFGRSWHSESEVGIYTSILLVPDLPVETLSGLPLLAGVAVVTAVNEFSHPNASLKWPNDILLNGKKLGGVLCETVRNPQGQTGVVVGIGINVNHNSFPEELRSIATSIHLEMGHPIDRQALILSLLHHLDREYQDFLIKGIAGITAKWSQHTKMFGSSITLIKGKTRIHGTALQLDEKGNLVIRTPEGNTMAFDSGEVTMES